VNIGQNYQNRTELAIHDGTPFGTISLILPRLVPIVVENTPNFQHFPEPGIAIAQVPQP
jgi:hypothetical protein